MPAVPGAALIVVRRIAGDLVLGPLVRPPCLRAEPVHRGRGIRLRDLEARGLTRGAGSDDGGEHAERAEQRPGMDAHRRMLRNGHEAVLDLLRLHEPRPHVVRDAVARHVLVRARHAVTRDRAEHDARVHLTKAIEAEASALEPTRPHRLDHDVGPPHEVEVRRHAFIGAQVEHDRPLAAADVQVHQRDALDDRPRHLPDVVALRRFDLDHLRAEVGEVGRDRTGAEHRALDDADARERRLRHEDS
jgi:hypothetical protein